MPHRFHTDLARLSQVPSELGNEEVMVHTLIEMLREDVDSIETYEGNVFVVRRGRLDGRILLSAHHDKVMTHPLPPLTEDPFYINGKLDNTIGVMCALHTFRSTCPQETPTLMALFTTGEEQGQHGAMACVKRKIPEQYAASAIIVLDAMDGQPRTGLFMNPDPAILPLERMIGRATPKKCGLADALMEAYARHYHETLTLKDYTHTDARVFARMTTIPTVALGIAVKNMHGPIETCSVHDLERLKDFLRSYLVKDDTFGRNHG